MKRGINRLGPHRGKRDEKLRKRENN